MKKLVITIYIHMEYATFLMCIHGYRGYKQFDMGG